MLTLFSVYLFVSVSILILCAWWLALWIKFCRYYLVAIPGPIPVPIIGNAIQTGASPDVMLQNLSKIRLNYGPVFKIMIGFNPVLVISDPEWMKCICSSSTILQKTYVYEFMHNWIREGLLTSSGSKWKARRRIITPAYHFQILNQFTDVFNSVAENLVKEMESYDREAVDVSAFTNLATLDTICETAMGVSINALSNKNCNYVQAIRKMAHIIIERGFSPLQQFKYTYYLTKNYYVEKASLKIIHQQTMNVIRTKRAEREISQNHNHDEPKKRLAFLDLLFESRVNGEALSDEDIREEVDTFMFAGHDTVSAALNFSIYCLSQNSEVQQKVYEEQQEIFGDNKCIQPTNEDISRMKYLELVIKETLRLFPSVPFIGRELTEDKQFGSHLLPKGLTVLMFIYDLHHDPKHFTDPEKFIPERFSEEALQKLPFTYMPFSAGPRNCIGQKFALLELKCMISRIIRHLKLLPVPGFKPQLAVETILTSTNGIKVKLQKRK